MSSVHALAALIRKGDFTREELEQAEMKLLYELAKATADEVRLELSVIARLLTTEDLRCAGVAAMFCGAVAEWDLDQSAVERPVMKRTTDVLMAASRLAKACRASVESTTSEGDRENKHKVEGDEARFARAMELVAPTMPLEAEAWNLLDYFWQPAIALLSKNPDLRREFQNLKGVAGELRDHHPAGHWLSLMLSVLHDEPVLVLEPAKGIGIEGRMSGVVDNFQLHVLLMDVFPQKGIIARLLQRRRVGEFTTSVARGEGPPQTDDVVTGYWNLYDWRAVNAELKLPSPKAMDASIYWIWGEGNPQDIPTFQGFRVILLGPASYTRTWGSQRCFNKLQARVRVHRWLGKSEVRQWLNQMATAGARS